MSAGILSQVSFKNESVWGTAVVPDKSIEVHANGGIKTNQDVKLLEQVKAQLAKNSDAIIGARKHEGEFEMDLFPEYPGYLLKSIFGSVSSALKGGESVVYEHSFSEAEAKPSLTIEQAITDNVRRYAGCIIHTVKISGKIGEPIIVTFGLYAKTQATATKISAAYQTGKRPFNWADMASGLKIGGSALSEVQSFEIEFKNNLEFLHALGNSNDPAINYVKGSEVKIKVDMYLDSTTTTEYANYLSKTLRAFDLIFTGDAIGTSSNYKWEVAVPKVAFTSGETPITDAYNKLTLEGEGVYDTSTSKLISMKLTNLLANYT